MQTRVSKEAVGLELPGEPAGITTAAAPPRRAPPEDVLETSATALSRAGRIRPVWWLVALLPFVALVLFPRLPGTGLGADDFGQYLMHARALATGHHYSDINYIYSPLNKLIGPATTLPGLPVLLAVVLRLAGPWLVPWVMLLIALSFPILVARYFARREPPLLALGAAMICVLSPAIVFAANQALTDLPFAAALWGTALLADAEGKPGWGRIAAVTLLGGAAFLLRIPAVAIAPALLLTALLRRRSGGLRLAIPVLVWGLLGVAALIVGQAERVLLIQIRPMEWVRQALVTGSPMTNLQAYGQALLDVQFQAAPHNVATTVLRALALALAALGVTEWLRRNPRSFLGVFAVLYGGLLVLLPWREDRYLWPLLPLATFGLLNGCRRAVARLAPGQAGDRVVVVATLLLSLLGAVGTASTRRPIDFGDQPEGRELLDYLRPLAAREPVRLTFMKPRMLAWTLDVPVLGTFRRPPAASLAELCDKRITHVITSEVREGHAGPLRAIADARPDLFQVTFSNRLYRVYRYSGRCGTTVAPPGVGSAGG